MKRIAAVAALAAVLLTACPPPAVAPPIGTGWWEAIKQAVASVIATAPDNTSINCSVVLFDQSVNPNDFTANWTPVYKPTPQLLPFWIAGCLGAQQARHIVPTFKASGNPNTYPPPNPNKIAVCWTLNFNPDGDMIFKCSFDRRPETSWVVNTLNSYDGYMAVGR